MYAPYPPPPHHHPQRPGPGQCDMAPHHQLRIRFQLHPDLRKIHEPIVPPPYVETILANPVSADYSFDVEQLVLQEGDAERQRRWQQAQFSDLLGREFAARWELQRLEREDSQRLTTLMHTERSEVCPMHVRGTSQPMAKHLQSHEHSRPGH